MADVLIAIALVGAAEFEIWVRPLWDDGIPGPRAVNAVLFALVASLAWRRRAPLAVLCLVWGAAAVQGVFFDPSPQPPLELFLALVVALYTVARHDTRGHALVAAAVVAPLVFVINLSHARVGVAAAEAASTWLVFAVVWLLGRYVHDRAAELARLRDRTAQLEQKREERAAAAVADERSRISRDLHDIIAHSVSVMVLQARGGRRMLAVAPADARKAFDSIESTGRQALGEMRHLVGILRSPDEAGLEPQPSMRHLDALVERIQRAGLPVELTIEGTVPQLPAGVDMSAYRIVQQALANTLEHAGSAHARVGIRYTPDAVEIEVFDDGAGPADHGGDGFGHGLIGMRERIALYGGELVTGPRPGGGYAVRARLLVSHEPP